MWSVEDAADGGFQKSDVVVEERAKTGSVSVIATNTNSLFSRSSRARIGGADGQDSKKHECTARRTYTRVHALKHVQ